MRSVAWLIPCAVGLSPWIGAWGHGAPSTGRAPALFESSDITVGWMTPVLTAPGNDTACMEQPPVGDGAFRPGHRTVASVIVTFERSRTITISRIGGLYGP
ncbi:MAG: hypothetical protein HOP29_09170 [Phycisphaerales bacterium]|nr:hypothetical protein [Phycisphaerales bacterium]